ncbi:MAG: hypothetical protein KJP18_14435, partial [Gemmatimonadetes bacterium]|nr:hypothetical protein [Gemmatimonadota bacterium]
MEANQRLDEARREAITRLASAWGRGEDGALDRLIEAVYDDLRVLARPRDAAHRAGAGAVGLELGGPRRLLPLRRRSRDDVA